MLKKEYIHTMPIKYKLSSVEFSMKIQRVKIFSNFWWIEEDTSEFFNNTGTTSKAWQALVRTLLTNPKQKNRKAEGSEYWYWRNFLICIKSLLFIGFYVIFRVCSLRFDFHTLAPGLLFTFVKSLLCHPYFQESAKIIFNFFYDSGNAVLSNETICFLSRNLSNQFKTTLQ